MPRRAAPTPPRGRSLGLLCAAGLACGDATDAPPAPPRWACPEAWVAYARGGCGPAAVLCAPGGDAALGACARWRPTPDAWPPREPTCAPGAWPCFDTAPARCPEGAAALPSGGCTATGNDACGNDVWPAPPPEAPATGVQYVLQSAPAAGADGTREHPWPDLARATRGAVRARWVVVGEGDYAEGLAVTTEVHVIGRCAARVTVSGRVAGLTMAHAVAVAGARGRLELAGVTLRENLIVGKGGGAVLRGVRVVGAHEAGVSVADAGSVFEGVDVLIERPEPATRDAAEGLTVLDGASASLRRSAVWGARRTGLAAVNGGSLALDDVAVRDTAGAEPSEHGGGVYVEGASLTARGVHVAGAVNAGVEVTSGGRATVEGLRVDDVAPTAEGLNGFGLITVADTEVDAGRVWVAGTRGLVAASAGAATTVADAALVATPPPGDSLVPAVVSRDRARLTLRRARVEGAHGVGLYAAAGALTVEDLALLGVAGADPEARAGAGVLVADGARFEARRARVEEVRGVGLAAFGAGTEAALDDATFALSPSLGAAQMTSGLLASDGAAVTASRVALLRPRGAAVAAIVGGGGATRVAADGLFVSAATTGRVLDDGGTLGATAAYGLFVGPGCALEARRAVLDGGGWGYVSTLGALRLRDALLRGQRDGVGAINGRGATSEETFERTVAVDNGRDEPQRDVALPEVRFSPPRFEP